MNSAHLTCSAKRFVTFLGPFPSAQIGFIKTVAFFAVSFRPHISIRIPLWFGHETNRDIVCGFVILLDLAKKHCDFILLGEPNIWWPVLWPFSRAPFALHSGSWGCASAQPRGVLVRTRSLGWTRGASSSSNNASPTSPGTYPGRVAHTYDAVRLYASLWFYSNIYIK